MITLDLGPYVKTPRKFKDLDDLSDFASVNLYKWRQQQASDANAFEPVIDAWNRLVDAIDMFRRNSADWPPNEIERRGHNHFPSTQLIPFDSPTGAAIVNVCQALGSEGARGFIAYLVADQAHNFLNGSQTRNFFSGAMLAWAAENNLSKDSVVGLRRSLQAVQQRAEDHNMLAIQQYKDFDTQAGQEFSALETQLLRKSRLANKAMGMLLAHFRRIDAERKAEWEALNDAYNEKIKLDAAVKLWSDQSMSHETKYRELRNWAIIAGTGGLIGLAVWVLLSTLFAEYLFGNMSGVTGASGLRLSWPYEAATIAAGTLIYSTIYLWTLRLIIRTMMAENHLAIDAKARSSMAHTYLALIKDGAAGNEDRSIVLASLFRPVTDGLVRDDAMPVISPAGLATRHFTG